VAQLDSLTLGTSGGDDGAESALSSAQNPRVLLGHLGMGGTTPLGLGHLDANLGLYQQQLLPGLRTLVMGRANLYLNNTAPVSGVA
jgi:hypothetical protein